MLKNLSSQLKHIKGEYIKLVLEDMRPVAGFEDEVVLEVRKRGKRSIIFTPS